MSEEKYLKTICIECGKEFTLNYLTVGISYRRYDDSDDEAMIRCPHCKTKYTY